MLPKIQPSFMPITSITKITVQDTATNPPIL